MLEKLYITLASFLHIYNFYIKLYFNKNEKKNYITL